MGYVSDAFDEELMCSFAIQCFDRDLAESPYRAASKPSAPRRASSLEQ